MSSVFIAVIVMWVLSIATAPIVRYIGISMYGGDGDMLWLAYLLYVTTIGSVYSFLIYVLCTLLLKMPFWGPKKDVSLRGASFCLRNNK